MIKKYKLFTTPFCPNCPLVKEHMATLDLEGDTIDASQEEGIEEAQKLGVSSVPTVIFFDEKGEKVGEAHSMAEINEILK